VNPRWILTALALLTGTYIVRALPFWAPDMSSVSPRIRRFLEVVPAAALGALIAPDAFGTVSVYLTAAILAVTVLLTLRGINLTVVVLIAIAGTWAGVTFL
jgi:branched-subunit amino acid transport protein